MNTSTKFIFQRFQGIENEILKLNNLIFALKTTDLQNYPANYEELSTDAALRAERIACQLRSLVYAADISNKSSYMKQAVKVHGINITRDGDILTIQLPGLLPKRRSHTNTAFLHEPLDSALQEYLKGHDLALYKDCVVCFCLVYDKKKPLRRIRDYDNLEFKQILDTIATYVLLDDTGLFCDAYYTTWLGEKDATLVYIMDKITFPGWIDKHKSQQENISEIS